MYENLVAVVGTVDAAQAARLPVSTALSVSNWVPMQDSSEHCGAQLGIRAEQRLCIHLISCLKSAFPESPT